MASRRRGGQARQGKVKGGDAKRDASKSSRRRRRMEDVNIAHQLL